MVSVDLPRDLTTDIASLLLGGSLKRKEMVSGRFADAISAMYEISSCIKLYEEKFQNDDNIESILKLSVLTLVKRLILRCEKT